MVPAIKFSQGVTWEGAWHPNGYNSQQFFSDQKMKQRKGNAEGNFKRDSFHACAFFVRNPRMTAAWNWKAAGFINLSCWRCEHMFLINWLTSARLKLDMAHSIWPRKNTDAAFLAANLIHACTKHVPNLYAVLFSIITRQCVTSDIGSLRTQLTIKSTWDSKAKACRDSPLFTDLRIYEDHTLKLDTVCQRY